MDEYTQKLFKIGFLFTSNLALKRGSIFSAKAAGAYYARELIYTLYNETDLEKRKALKTVISAFAGASTK